MTKTGELSRFNTQPPEGGWHSLRTNFLKKHFVSTHSRPKAAGNLTEDMLKPKIVSTHSRPKAAGQGRARSALAETVSTHSRPKAAGNNINTRMPMDMFQHTAARRRLEPLSKALLYQVSQP